jgi:hypothetical protein
VARPLRRPSERLQPGSVRRGDLDGVKDEGLDGYAAVQEPPHVSGGSPSGVVLADRSRAWLLQEMDIGSSSEITLGAALTQMSRHEETAAFSFINRSAWWAAIRAARGVRQGQFQGQLGDSVVPATERLAYT